VYYTLQLFIHTVQVNLVFITFETQCNLQFFSLIQYELI
jgi:hypothetical protein